MATAAAIVAHYAVPVKPSPVVPVPAATLVLLRDAGGGVETLLLQRHPKSAFAAGDFVFPGGKLHGDDNPEDAEAWCTGVTAADAARVLGLEGGANLAALGYWIGAIRETFEEAGVLLATDRDGAPARTDHPRFAEYRWACQSDNRAFWAMLKTEGLRLTTDRLVYFAHWVTPDDLPLRFDTRFFAASMPADQTATGDGKEVTELRWLTPGEALDAATRGEISLRNPTIKNLMLFTEAASGRAALDRLHGRTVTTVRPRVIFLPDGTRQVLHPGDPGYDSA
jgi:8-oxo-dGTP pyrophosphatase MutT (NUDIX family)